jgi:hypothetical protein
MIWLVVVAANVAVVMWTSKRLERRATRLNVAAGDRARASACAPARFARRWKWLTPERWTATPPRRQRTPGSRGVRASRRKNVGSCAEGAVQATGAATVAAACFAFRRSEVQRRLPRHAAACERWRGTLLPRIAFDNLPPNVLRAKRCACA